MKRRAALVSLWIAWRYFRSQGKQRFLPLLTSTAIAGVALGLMAMIVVLSIMRGFQRELTERFLGFNAHITLRPEGDAASSLEGAELETLLEGVAVRHVHRLVEGEVIAQSLGASPQALGISIRGLESDALQAMPSMDYAFGAGEFPADPFSTKTGRPGLLLGYEAAGELLVHPDFADEVEVTAPLASLTPAGELGPNSRRYELIGVFRSGVYEYDAKVGFLPLEEARKLLGAQAREGLMIRLQHPQDVERVLSQLRPRLPKAWDAQGWHEMNRKLFAALKLERLAMGVILTLVLIIASFSIAAIVLLITAWKRKDMAILKSLGLTPRQIRAVFMFQGLFIGAIGALLGSAMGIGMCLMLKRWPVPLPSTYYLDRLPADLDPFSITAFVASALVIALVAAALPTGRPARENPCEVLRCE